MGKTHFHFATSQEAKRAANAAAYEAGLTCAAEYMRIALEYLVEHKSIPEEFKGRRAVMKVGRPLGSALEEVT
ncbi:hypothetical protein QTH90_08500 [Variovorax sp. J2P1-59]|uniref:hypothetical protein n=1 Tax=Variovorax flavidus TaxID=3053501 RepID=UPI0025752B0A|nr:hypothetical protein [Variovorax sp. J2P1-59]MDM0074418.1 hypothetical protein [Variovorax sp. J2P1-59]